MMINMADLTPAQVYFSLIQTIIPRPVAWVLTANQVEDEDESKSKEGRYNLAPFSYFTPICSDPPLLLISVGVKGKNEAGQTIAKDTSRNLQANGRCTVHIANVDLAKEVTQSSATLAYGDSELTGLKLDLSQHPDFALPAIKQCPIALDCRLYKIEQIGKVPQTLLYLEVEHLYIDDALNPAEAGRLQLDANVINPLARLGADQYAGLSESFMIKRPR